MATLLAILSLPPQLMAQTTFDFQGRLFSSGQPGSSDVDFRFHLFDGPSGGTPLGPALEVPAQSLSNGYFNLSLDFGAALLNSGPLWIEIEVRFSGQPGYTLLSPRQALKQQPRAVIASQIGNGGVASGSIVDASLTSEDFAGGAVGTSELAPDSIGTSELAENFLASGEIASNAVTSDQLASNAVNASHITTNAVGSSEIAENAVIQSRIATNGVGSSEIATGAVLTHHIAAGAVTAAEIGANQIGSSKIQNASVGASKVNSSEVQLRVSGNCANSSSIRSVAADGSVTCEPDDQGILGFGAHEVFSVSSSSGGGNVDVNMGSLGQKMCFISSIEVSSVDGSSEIAECILINLGTWILRANSAGSNASVSCQARCLNYLTNP